MRRSHASFMVHTCKPCFGPTVSQDAPKLQQVQENSSYGESKSLEHAFTSLEMLPSIEHFIHIIQSCRQLKNLKSANYLYMHILNNGLEGHTVLGNYLVPMFVECGSVSDAWQVFRRLRHRNEYSWTSLIQGYVDCGQPLHAFALFEKMQLECMHPSRYTFMALLKACAKLKHVERGQELHAEIAKEDYEGDIFVANALLDMYGKCGFLLEAQEIFGEMKTRDVVSWTTMIGGYAEYGFGKEVLDCLEKMQSEGLSPNVITAACSLNACSIVGDIDRGRIIHAEITKGEFEGDSFVANTLLGMYAKSGLLAEAKHIFDKLPTRNIVSWTALIAGYADDGLCEETMNHLDQMQMEGVSPDAVTLVCFLKACSNANSLSKGRETHEEIIMQGFEKDLSVGCGLVDMYAKCGSLAEAQEVFNKMPVQNIVLCNTLIAGFAEKGLGEKALSIFEQMQVEGMSQDTITFVCALKACGSIKAVDRGQAIHMVTVKEGFNADPCVGSSLVDMYAKCGLLLEAQKVFDELPLKNVVSWTALTAGYMELGFGEEALNCMEQMQSQGLLLDALMLVCGLKACACSQAQSRGQGIHADLVKRGLTTCSLVGSVLVDMYAKCGLLLEAQEVFDELLVQDVVSWNALITGYVECGFCEKALECLEQMQREGVSQDAITFACTLKACARMGAIGRGREIHTESTNYGFERNPRVCSTLVDMYADCKSIAEARQILEEFPVRDLVLWNVLITSYAEHGHADGVANCLEQMQLEGVSPNAISFVCSLKACGRDGTICRGQQMHTEIARVGFDRDLSTGNTLVDMYGKFGLLAEAREVFDELPARDVVSWNTLIARYIEHGHSEEALKCLGQMQVEGMSLNGVTLACSLKACGIVGAISRGREVHYEIAKECFELDAFVGRALLDMYAKCGSHVEAQDVFGELKVRDVVSWSALIAGYAYQGESSLVFCLFNKMEEEHVCPNSLTLLSVLSACSHAGLVDEGKKFFSGFSREYDIIMGIKHHNCMVDLLGRAGQLDDAVALLENMPFHPDLVTWHSTMSACQRWGDIQVGTQAFACAVSLDKKADAAFVLMSNIRSIYLTNYHRL